VVVQLIGIFETYFDRFLVLQPGLPLILALWSLGTYCFKNFEVFPYLAITSPVKRCGKTRLEEILTLLCHNPRFAVGLTPATLFRSIEKSGPEMCATVFPDTCAVLLGNSRNAL
jgi:hypothetical protein